MDKVPDQVIRSLIKIGAQVKQDQLPEQRDLLLVQPHDHINRFHWEDWSDVSETLEIDELALLTQGLSYAVEEYRWAGGSVSGVIWLLESLYEASPETWLETATRIHAQTTNPWVIRRRPTFGARSHSEYLQKQFEHDAWLIARREEIRAKEAEARHQRTMQRRNTARDRNTPERKAFLTALAELTIEDQLVQLARDQVYSVGFYPAILAGRAQQEILLSLDEATKWALQEKVKGTKRGPWRSFKRRLKKVLS